MCQSYFYFFIIFFLVFVFFVRSLFYPPLFTTFSYIRTLNYHYLNCEKENPYLTNGIIYKNQIHCWEKPYSQPFLAIGYNLGLSGIEFGFIIVLLMFSL